MAIPRLHAPLQVRQGRVLREGPQAVLSGVLPPAVLKAAVREHSVSYGISHHGREVDLTSIVVLRPCRAFVSMTAATLQYQRAHFGLDVESASSH
jgi:hypothetical protein